MARIAGLAEKQAALVKINGLIKSLGPLNRFLTTPNDSGEYEISFNGCSATLVCPDKSELDKYIKARKGLLVEEIHSIAGEFGLSLDDQDLQIVDGLYVPPLPKPKRRVRKVAKPETFEGTE